MATAAALELTSSVVQKRPVLSVTSLLCSQSHSHFPLVSPGPHSTVTHWTLPSECALLQTWAARLSQCSFSSLLHIWYRYFPLNSSVWRWVNQKTQIQQPPGAFTWSPLYRETDGETVGTGAGGAQRHGRWMLSDTASGSRVGRILETAQ